MKCIHKIILIVIFPHLYDGLLKVLLLFILAHAKWTIIEINAKGSIIRIK